MIGLRPYERDTALPVRLGDEDLGALPENEVISAIVEHLIRPGQDTLSPTGATLEYARWKPGVSSTWSYRVAFSDGDERIVTLKRYRAEDKVVALLDRRDTDEHLAATLGPMRAFHGDPGRRLTVWVFPADRALRGLARAVNTARAARLVESALGPSGPRLRKRAARAEVLRYKPERRAIVLLKIPRHGGRDTRSVRAVLRIHPLDKARRIAENRAASPVAREIGPEFLTLDEPTGTLVEAWLRGKPAERNEYGHAAEAGALLARLHAAPAPRAALAPVTTDAARPWLERLPDVRPVADAVPELPLPDRTAWTHGDVHPEQFLTGKSGMRLLDLDELGPGDPARDLAGWIADRLALDGDARFDDASVPLLEGYESAGGRIDPGHLRLATAHTLVRKAAGCLRRLERGAIDRARRQVEQAALLARESRGFGTHGGVV